MPNSRATCHGICTGRAAAEGMSRSSELARILLLKPCAASKTQSGLVIQLKLISYDIKKASVTSWFTYQSNISQLQHKIGRPGTHRVVRIMTYPSKENSSNQFQNAVLILDN